MEYSDRWDIEFILIAENVLNFHFDIDDYYAEWLEDVEEGWICVLNLQEHVQDEFFNHKLHYYLNFGDELNNMNWRTQKAPDVFQEVNHILSMRLESPEDEFWKEGENELSID